MFNNEDLEGENLYEILPSNSESKNEESNDKNERSESPSLKPPVEINGNLQKEEEKALKQQTFPQRSQSAGCRSMTQKHPKGDSKRKNRYSLFLLSGLTATPTQEEEEKDAQKDPKVMMGFFGRKSRKDDFVESKNKRKKKRKKKEEKDNNSNKKAVSFAEDVLKEEKGERGSLYLKHRVRAKKKGN